jgi:uncharacterized Zn finger protein
MTELPKLTEAHVRRWTGERYFRRGHILDPRRQGQALKARCLGSRPTPYDVELELVQATKGHSNSKSVIALSQESQEYAVRPGRVCLETVDS